MNYCISNALFYLSFFDMALQEHLIDVDFSVFFEGASKIYALTEQEKAKILSYWNNDMFKKMNSAATVKFHLEFLKNFDSAELFGSAEDEKTALKSKFYALSFYDRLLNGKSDLISAFEENIGNKQVTFLFSALYFMKLGKVQERLMSNLRKNVTLKECCCDFDSLLLLLVIDTLNCEQYKNILLKSSFKLYEKDHYRIMQAYFGERKEMENDIGRLS